MTEYGTIKIPRAEYEKHNDRRKELGLEWIEYINRESVTELTEDDVREIARAEIRELVVFEALE